MLDDNGLGARLRRLPGQFLLALVNASAILVIAATVLAIIAVARIEQVAGNIAMAVTDAVFAQVDIDPRQAIVDMRKLRDEVHSLGAELAQARVGAQSAEATIDELNGRLQNLQDSLDALLLLRVNVVEDVLRAASERLASGIAQFGRCEKDDGA